MSTLEQLGRVIAGLDVKTMPDALRQKLRLHVADVVGAWVAATATAEGKALVGFRGATARSLGDHVMINCALARLSEIDDIHLAAMTTPGAIVVPAALTICASLPPVDADELAAAIAAGYEVMIRLGLAIDGPTALYRGIWPTYIGAPLGVAAGAARLFKLDATQTAHALASALTLSAPGVGHHNAATTTRWFAIGHAARGGLVAAQGAQMRFTADLDLLDGPFFKNVYGITPKLSAFTDDLDQPSSLAQLSFKPWCAARQTMPAVQALKDIIASGVEPDHMTEIRVAVLPPHLKMIDHGVVSGDRASFLTSLPYQMAAAALAPAALDDLSQTKLGLTPPLHAFMDCITLNADVGMLADYPVRWTARVTVVTSTGSHERTVTQVPGDPADTFDGATVTSKFVRFAAPVLGERDAIVLLGQALGVLSDARHCAIILQRIGSAT